MSIKSVMLSNHFKLCCYLLIFSSIFLSNSVFSSELALHIKWPKYWSFSFSIGPSHEVAKILESQLGISPSNEYPGLISFRMHWLDLLASSQWRAAVNESLTILTSLFIDMTGNTLFFTEIKIIINHCFIKFRILKATWGVGCMTHNAENVLRRTLAHNTFVSFLI